MRFPERVTNYRKGDVVGKVEEEKKSTKLFAIELLHAKCLNNMDVIFSPLHDTKNLNQLYFMQP